MSSAFWRKGRKWRVETVRSTEKEWPLFPLDADAAWWKQHQTDFTSEVNVSAMARRSITTGRSTLLAKPDAKDRPPLKLTMTQPINPSDDPFMPSPDVFTEHIAHPSVWQPTPDREFLFDGHPSDGPPQTVRLRVRDSRPSEQARPDLYRLWLSPERRAMSRCGRKQPCLNRSTRRRSPTSTPGSWKAWRGRPAVRGMRLGFGESARMSTRSRSGHSMSTSRSRCRMKCSSRSSERRTIIIAGSRPAAGPGAIARTPEP